MKIRSDFVTNSSSSSFTVNIVVKDIDGNEYTASSDPEDLSAEASIHHDLDCTAEEILNAGSVSELADLLANSMQEKDDNDDEYEEEYDDDDDEGEKMREYAYREVKALRDKLIENIGDLSQIASIKATREWYAWGEGSSCWAADKFNVPFYDLYELAQAFLDADGEEKEKTKEKLKEFASDEPIINEWNDEFPSGFLGSKGKWHLDWSLLTDDIEEFAKMVVNLDIPNEDYAEEITEIDMQNHTIKQEANYIPGGPAGEDEDED